MSEQKTIHGSLDEIVEAVKATNPEYINREHIRTALERFVVGKDTHKKGGDDEG